jgi:polysaccharide export outer membrane protein
MIALSGCFLAPGMQMDEDAALRRGRATTKNENFDIQPITADLLKRLAREAAVQRETDPLESEAAAYEYRVSAYDVLTVVVWDHPELTMPTGQFRSPEENGLRVGGDGTIFYPYVGVVRVVGMTVAEIRKVITERLANVITRPQVDVRISAFRGRRAQITGEVVQPSVIAITDVPLRIQDAIAQARGLTPEADYSNVSLTRGGRVHRLNLQALYEAGDASQNWILRDGDVVNVGDRNRNKVFVIGEVRQQAARVMVKGRMTLAEALIGTAQPGETALGGFDPQFSNTGRIYVIRGDFDAPSIYRLDASSPDALLLAANFQMKPRDVVFVATYDLGRASRVMDQIVPTVNGLWQVYDVVQRSR